MAEHDKVLVKSFYALAQFDPKAQKELVVRGLTALTEVRDTDFYFFKGEEYRIRGELNIAISYYEKALQIDPEHENSLFWIGYCWLRINRIQKIRKRIQYYDVKYYRDNDPVISDYEYDLLKQELQNIQPKGYMEITQEQVKIYYEKAINTFQKLIDIREKKDGIWLGDYASYYNLGLAQYSLELYKEAIESFERAIKLNPDNANFYYILGLAQEELGIYHSALENFETYLLLVDHELPENQRKITYAQKHIEELGRQLTDDYFFFVGFNSWSNGQYREAIKCYEKVIELNPDYTSAYYNLALAQDEIGIYHLAMKNFKTYLTLDDYKRPKVPECVKYAKKRIKELKELLTYTYFYNLGIKFWKENRYEEAIECYERAIELNPRFADAYYNLALAHEAMIQNRQLSLFPDEDRKVIHKLCQLALVNFETYLHLENYELAENQRFITYTNNRIKALREMLRKSKQG